MSRPQRISLRFPLLNFLELSTQASFIENRLIGARVDRVFVPALPEHPNGYFKQEWCMDFYSNEQSGQLFFSLRPQACGVFLLPPKTLKVASQATRSGFDLSLVKHLEGHRLNALSMIRNERIMELKFGSAQEEKVLLLSFIPAMPEAILLSRTESGQTETASSDAADPSPTRLTVLNRSREGAAFVYPTGREMSADQVRSFSLRPEFGSRVEFYPDLYLKARVSAGLAFRLAQVERTIKERTDYWKKKSDSFKEQLAHSDEDPQWDKYGALLQSQFYTQPKLENGFYTLMDFEADQEVRIPGDSKLNLKQQLEHYFHQAKRGKTRIREAHERMKTADEKIAELDSLQSQLASAEPALPVLLDIEGKLGIGKVKAVTTKAVANFGGKIFSSVEGLTIVVGRNLTENLELTFKVARGNDIWLHVRGRPGAHAAILIPPKRSASLDTLLDAAHLCIHYSGGKDWGKTEVDYTFRKFVKKIKNQTEVKYTNNKTLMVTPDPVRTKRLLGESN